MLRFAAALLMSTVPALAQEVAPCDWRASAWNLVEPWEANTRTFANGQTRLALLDTVEPGAVPFHILVLSPPYDELGARSCRVVSYGGGFGFHRIALDEIEAEYDPAVGLMFEVPVEIWLSDTNIVSRPLQITVNQATGMVGASLP